MEAFAAWLRAFYLDTSEYEAHAHWENFVATSPDLALEELRCISEVAASPPKDLVLVIEQYASMYTWRRGRRIPWTHDDYVKWLKEMVLTFSVIAERHGLPNVSLVDREASS
ncbi:hypothetical protein [Streptomyces sp. NPDC002215]|uniref:hypothetical protein n=1 Tax=Streptomyces sp. NPDC002215 TaxID=3154412 RepID=UPI003329C695